MNRRCRCWCRWAFWRSARWSRARFSTASSSATSRSGFWRGAVAAIAGHAGGREVPLWVEFAPFVATIVGFAIAYYYYVLHPDLPPEMAARKRAASTTSSTTNGISTSSTTSCSSARRCGSAASCGSSATARSSTGSGLTASRPACSMRRAARCGCNGLRLSLCLRDADRRRGARDLVHGRGRLQ